MSDKSEAVQVKHKNMAGARAITRLYAVQMMYRAEQEGCSVLDFFQEILDGSPVEVILTENISLTDIDMEFYKDLVSVTQKNLKKIDQIISSHLQKNWHFERLDMIIKNILRLATAELLFFSEIPNNVTFNEYIEIAKAFSDEKSETAFVNGILNRIAQDEKKIG